MSVLNKIRFGLFFQKPSVVLIIGILMLAFGHILYFPYLQLWDDSMYADDALSWIQQMKQDGLLRGFLLGWLRDIPGHYPPVVLLTNVFGWFCFRSLHGMQLAHWLWFAVLLIAARTASRKVAGEGGAFFTVALIGFNPLLFYHGTRIMGEPAMFAAMALVFWWLAKYYDVTSPLAGILLGIITAFGFLCKQHFPFAIAGALLVWLGCQGCKSWKDRSQAGSVFIMLYLAATTLSTFAFLPWFSQRWRDIWSRYGNSEHFTPHSFGADGTIDLLGAYLRHVLSGIGVITAVLLIVGTVAACRCSKVVFPFLPSKIRIAYALSLLAACCFLGFFLVRMDNNQLRFSAPAFIPVSFLAGPGLAALWVRQGQWHKIVIVLLLACLPGTLFCRLYEWRPADPGPLSDFVGKVDHLTRNAEEDLQTYVLGSTETFNRRSLSAMLKERGNYRLGRLRDFFVSWKLRDNELDLIREKLAAADVILVNHPVDKNKIHHFLNPDKTFR